VTLNESGSSPDLLLLLRSLITRFHSGSECHLRWCHLRWQYKGWNLFRAGLEKLRRIMADANPLCRRLLTISVTVLAVVVIALSTASRWPYTSTNSTSWHTTKASRMNPACRKVGGEAEVRRRDPDFERQPTSDRRPSFLAFEPHLAKPLFLRGADQFRSPPFLLL